MQRLGQQQNLPAAEPVAFLMHPCMAERAPCKLLQIIAYSFPLANQQQSKYRRLPHPHTRAGVQVLHLIASADFLCSYLSTRGAHHTFVRT
eukprot:1146856-Pelagomonas_calceolata.AAC.10